MINPFPTAGTDGQTVSVLQGARYSVSARAARASCSSPSTRRSRPSTATRRPPGSPTATWPVADRWIEVGFNAPRDVPYVDVYPLTTSTASSPRSTSTASTTRSAAGWTRIPVNLHARQAAAGDDRPRRRSPSTVSAAPAAFARSASPASTSAQLLRAPIVLGRDLAGRRPAPRQPQPTCSSAPPATTRSGATRTAPTPCSTTRRTAGTPRAQIDRLVFAPAARALPRRRLGLPGGQRGGLDARPARRLPRAGHVRLLEPLSGSARLPRLERVRPATAARAGSGVWDRPRRRRRGSRGARRARCASRRLRLRAVDACRCAGRRVVQLSWPGGATPAAAGGRRRRPSRCREPVRARVVPRRPSSAPRSRPAPPRASARPQAVGIGSLVGARAGAGARSPRKRSAARALRHRRGHGRRPPRAAAAVRARSPQLDAGRPLRAAAAARRAALADARCRRRPADPLAARAVQRRPAAAALAGAGRRSPRPARGGQRARPGHIGNSSVSGVRVALRGPSWLVLGESFDNGWRATCDGRSLGAPQVIDGYANGWLAPGRLPTRVVLASRPRRACARATWSPRSRALLLIAVRCWCGARPRARRGASARRPRPAAPRPCRAGGDCRCPRAARAGAARSRCRLGYVFALRAGAVASRC